MNHVYEQYIGYGENKGLIESLLQKKDVFLLVIIVYHKLKKHAFDLLSLG